MRNLIQIAYRYRPSTSIRTFFLFRGKRSAFITLFLILSDNHDEAKEFVKKNTPEAYKKLVDDLLNDPRFGERMAVHWLDLVRYSDTIGYHSDNFMEVSAYRDYVIEAFNKNLPYDQFVIENLAGDLIPEATVSQKIASGYNRLLQYRKVEPSQLSMLPSIRPIGFETLAMYGSL